MIRGGQSGRGEGGRRGGGRGRRLRGEQVGRGTFDTAALDLGREAARELGPLEKTGLPSFGADCAPKEPAPMLNKVMARLVNFENEVVEMGTGG